MSVGVMLSGVLTMSIGVMLSGVFTILFGVILTDRPTDPDRPTERAKCCILTS